VVFLKQLTSGLLLVTGPYGTNGVPLRRINQKYAISTSTKVPVTGVDVSSIDDAFFAREKKSEAGKKEKSVSAARKDAQVKVDASLLANIKKMDMLESYLKAKFTLRHGDKPYLMKF